MEATLTGSSREVSDVEAWPELRISSQKNNSTFVGTRRS